MVLAGVPLAIVYLMVLVAALGSLKLEFDANNWAQRLLVIGALGLGPASAYSFKRWLNAHRVSQLAGCGTLVVWVVALLVGASAVGWLGVAVVVILSGVAFVRWGLKIPTV